MKAMVPKGPSMNEMLRQAQKMQEDMQNKQAELEAKEYDVSAGGGVIKIKINGKREILSIDLAPEIVDPDDIDTLNDIIVAGVNEAIKKVNADADEEMKKVTGPLGGMPGMF
ncbi:MAG: YbaB/EbfC family nucleoid-associated protein [Ruminococcaceae bacterium]|nr:YbaB/EbfC family nucleoid-associated protein [Oscillospiraceae bacterium]